jgi:hypothetical protein
MDVDRYVLDAVAAALTKGQDVFTEEELTKAREEIKDSLIRGNLATLILEGEASLLFEDGTLLYSVSGHESAPASPTSLEVLIESDKRDE